ncbi:DEAD/DEAH box helicase [Lysinibacillus piscis]|uniref:DNA/RNA helicase n=1 Tax=Lysinibacillus piscis TaxID=2518931 RepID=A0ABQ5NHI8_9BACI|nr:DEAD/DEAH box helicase family protein [Lysinibacillus sp. KH24]GLC87838.1 DNA/RNA helicase [Lysinibacillus sp. KH24]
MNYRSWIVPPALRDFHEGRIWLKEHSPFAQQDIERALQHHYVQVLPGIQTIPSIKCNRCHNQNRHQFILFDCAKCQKTCVYCRHCIKMGRVSSCTQLMIWAGPRFIKQKKHTFHWTGQFTLLQRKAADEVLASVKQRRSHIITAVCGAGKTELLFPTVYYALCQGLRICIATPRTDVVLELFPRFQRTFPQTTIHALYGDAPKQEGYAQLIIATTHQLYRFKQAFDVMIVDEADAFPYVFDDTLQQAVQKAKTAIAPIIVVTATPSQKLLSQFPTVQRSFIPKRYHNHPLPVPQFSALWRYEKCFRAGKIPRKLKKWVEHQLAQQRPFLLFFPTIELMLVAEPLFQAMESTIVAVHAEDPERKEKVLQLRQREVKGLLTTTILERGITIANVQVAVIGAESAIFTASALIQIAGRVGRHVDFADGDILFFHHGITAEMDEARAEIIKYNKEGFSE